MTSHVALPSPPGPEPSLAHRAAQTDAALVHAIAEVTRALSRSTPAPRGQPFFGLDMGIHEPLLLDELCREGIFRKYERVVIVDSGLGGAARWWASRWGCTVIGTEVRSSLAHGASVLSRRALLYGPTTFVAAQGDAGALRPECVTHVWLRDVSGGRNVEVLLREAWCALRPGGHVTADATAPAVIDALHASAQAQGFIAIEAHSIAPVAAPHALLTALSQLDAFVARTQDETLRSRLLALVAERRAAALEPPQRLQFFAQRPS